MKTSRAKVSIFDHLQKYQIRLDLWFSTDGTPNVSKS
jgi:hypothetical protein